MQNGVLGEVKRISGCVLNYIYATDLIACGEMAGNVVFGKLPMKSKKSIVLRNAIDIEKYSFDEEIRSEIRNKFNMKNKFVVGTVGRISKEKNHLFLLELVKKMKMKTPNIHLFIVGDGEERTYLEKYVHSNSMEEYVTFYGKTNKVNEFYPMFDVFGLPSFYEGFPLVVVEAAANGLPVITSDNVSKEILGFDGVKQCSLGKIEQWENLITKSQIDNDERKKRSMEFKKYGFDLQQNAKILERVYMRRE